MCNFTLTCADVTSCSAEEQKFLMAADWSDDKVMNLFQSKDFNVKLNKDAEFDSEL